VLANQRRDFIVGSVRRMGSMRVRDLAEQLDVSEMTVRRDIDELARQQLIEKVHGGATSIGDLSSFEPGFAAKQRRQRDEKDAIAERALELVRPQTAIGLTAGTTTWTFARRLRSIPGLRVVTNAPSVAQVLYGGAADDMTVVLTGGVRTPSDALVGPLATEALSKLHVDILFMGVHGIDPKQGYSTPNLAEAEVNAAFIEAADRVVVVADHTKWAMRGLARIAPLDRADLVISDDGLAAEARAAFADLRVQLSIVTPAFAREHSA